MCRPGSLLTWNFDTWISPVVGVSSASTSRMKVDLPEPDGPMRKTNSPLSILRLTLSSAGRADDLYCLLTWSRVIITARQCSGDYCVGAAGVGSAACAGAGDRTRRRRGRPGSGGAGRCGAVVAGGPGRRRHRRRRQVGGGGLVVVDSVGVVVSVVVSVVVGVVVVVVARSLDVGARHPGVVRVGHEARRHDLGFRRRRRARADRSRRATRPR